MGFYDNYNFEGLKFLSNIQTHPEDYISEPCPEVIETINFIKQRTTPPLRFVLLKLE